MVREDRPHFPISSTEAQVVKLADTQRSGRCDRKVVGVQISPWAQSLRFAFSRTSSRCEVDALSRYRKNPSLVRKTTMEEKKEKEIEARFSGDRSAGPRRAGPARGAGRHASRGFRPQPGGTRGGRSPFGARPAIPPPPLP